VSLLPSSRLLFPPAIGALVAFAALVTGCATARPADPPEPGPGEGPLVLLEPRWDQVCRDDRTPRIFRTPPEVLNDPSRVLREVARSLPDPVAGEPHPRVDVAVTYARSGQIRTVHYADANVDRAVADRVVELVAAAVRPQGPLIQPTFLRIRALREPGPVFRILPGQFCLAHITHEEDEPPRFLEGARSGSRRVAGPSAETAPEPWIIVDLHISRSGELLRVEPSRGDETLLPRVIRALSETTFDPALLNGEPTRSIMPLLLRFPD
jgi:hypothetical protein